MYFVGEPEQRHVIGPLGTVPRVTPLGVRVMEVLPALAVVVTVMTPVEEFTVSEATLVVDADEV